METQTTDSTSSIPPPEETLAEIMTSGLIELREKLVDWLGAHLVKEDRVRDRTVIALRDLLSSLDDPTLEALRKAYLVCGDEVRFYPVETSGRMVGHAFLKYVADGARIDGLGNLRKASALGPVLLISNHLSYADSQVTEYLTAKLGDDGLARKLTFVAGPKVYENPFRRMAAVALNTIPTAQSARLSYNQANQSPREVAKIALKTIRATLGLMRDGYLVLLYAEGTRSRTGRLDSFLKGTTRYAQLEGLHIVPLALTGTESMFPIHESRLRSATVILRYGEPISASPGRATEAMTAAWHALAGLLPASHRPEEGVAPLA
jgi:1-acyl-sn-glycerol-3-phosphate acyltransferase